MRSPPPFSPQSPTPRRSQPAPSSSPTSTRSISQSLSALSLASFAAPRAPIRIDPLPPNQDHSGATWLEHHTPFPVSGTADGVVAALAAFRAAEAYPSWEMLDSSGSSDHDPRYYIREKTRRLHMYLLLTSVISKMCAYLDLTTGASIYLFVCRPERMNGQGQRSVKFRNRLGGEVSMRAAYDAAGRAAEAWADLQVAGFSQRTGRLDIATRSFRDACTSGGIPIHATGDFPLLARLDGGVAHELIEATSRLDRTSFGLTQTQHPLSQLQSIGEHSKVAVTSPHNERSIEETDWESATESDDEDSEWVGRRATSKDKEAMSAAGLDRFQSLRVRLMLWERPPKQWQEALRQIIGDDNGLILQLLTALL
ncbi:hypothetical protein FRC01_009129 [Tulasnella sp. 417]|nr:hypothetical protein FRC01_009129 [Tulasnella sp. 417]